MKSELDWAVSKTLNRSVRFLRFYRVSKSKTRLSTLLCSFCRSLQVDKQRAGFEGQVRELQSRLEEAEANATKSNKKLAQKLEQRVAEMETAVDAERRRYDELQKTNRKQDRRVYEMLSQVEAEQRVKAQLQDNGDHLQQKLKTFKRQVEEAVRWFYFQSHKAVYTNTRLILFMKCDNYKITCIRYLTFTLTSLSFILYTILL